MCGCTMQIPENRYQVWNSRVGDLLGARAIQEKVFDKFLKALQAFTLKWDLLSAFSDPQGETMLQARPEHRMPCGMLMSSSAKEAYMLQRHHT